MPLFQNESVQSLSYENEFDLHEEKHVSGTHFHIYEWCVHTKTCFETKAKDNSKMAYLHGKYTVLCYKVQDLNL